MTRSSCDQEKFAGRDLLSTLEAANITTHPMGGSTLAGKLNTQRVVHECFE